VIHTRTTTTQVLGTAFNLRAKPDESAIELSVTEGKVIFGADKKIEVKAGESATFDEQSRQVAAYEVNANATSWKTGELNFNNAKLRTVFRDLGRYYHVKVEAENPALLNCRLSAYFNDASLELVLKVITQTTDLTYTVEGDTYVVRGKTYCDGE
jgi:ferric-dicitrate binding protein FerR (iron transport regulator)